MWKKKRRVHPGVWTVRKACDKGCVCRTRVLEEKMNNIEAQTEILIDEIKKSNVYSEYIRALENLKQETDLYQKVCQFRRRRFYSQVEETGNSLQENEELTAQLAELSQTDIVIEFLMAEQRYCKMIRKVNDRILDSVGINIDFLED